MALGVNFIGGNFSNEQAAAFAQTLGIATHVVINETKLAAMLVSMGNRVIFRLKGEHFNDDHAFANHEPRAFVQTLHNAAPEGCFLYLGNEPGTGALELLDSWSRAAMAECKTLGRKAVLYHFETSHPNAAEIRKLKASAQMAKRDGHLIGLHEYFDETVGEGIADGHVGHFRLWREILGEDCPEIVITETGCCPGYQPRKGWKESANPDAQPAELETLAGFYHAHEVDAQVYAYSADPLWDSFSILNADKMQGAMTTVNAALRTTPPPVVTAPPKAETPTPEPGTFRLTLTNAFMNVRSFPTITPPNVESNIVTRIYRDTRVRLLRGVEVDGWLPIAIPGESETVGWVYTYQGRVKPVE